MGGAAERTRALIDEVAECAGSRDPGVLLEMAVAVASDVGDAVDGMVEHYVAAARAAGLSWTVIGQRLGVSRQAARQRFTDRIGPSVGDLTMDRPTIGVRLAGCLEAAQAAADADDSVPSTHHLLMGLLHAGGAAGVLDKAGVTREKIRAAAGRLFEPTLVTTDEGQRRVVGDGGADRALAIAHRMAARRGQSEVRSEHVLLELATDDGASSRRVLNDLGVDIGQLKKDLNQMIPPAPRRPRGRKPGRAACDARDRACSFCGATDPARPMVAGPGVWICADCVTLATDILTNQTPALRPG